MVAFVGCTVCVSWHGPNLDVPFLFFIGLFGPFWTLNFAIVF